MLFHTLIDKLLAMELSHAVGLLAFGERVTPISITTHYESFHDELGRLDASEGSTALLPYKARRRSSAVEFGPYHYLRLLMFVVTEIDGGGQDNDTFECEEEIQKLQIVIEMAVKLLDQKAHLLFY